jgi:hypothetical protein
MPAPPIQMVHSPDFYADLKMRELDLVLKWVAACKAPPREFQAAGWTFIGGAIGAAVSIVAIGSAATLAQMTVMWGTLVLASIVGVLALAMDWRSKLSVVDSGKQAEEFLLLVKGRTVGAPAISGTGTSGGVTPAPAPPMGGRAPASRPHDRSESA